jgi:hypothetical protein
VLAAHRGGQGEAGRGPRVSDDLGLSTRLHGRVLVMARVGWVALALVTLTQAAAGFVVGFRRPELISQQTVLQAVTAAGIPIRIVLSVGLLLPMVAFSVTGLVLFWRKPDDWMALLFALTLLIVGVFATRSLWALERALPQLRLPARIVSLAALALLVVLCCVFPDGRFVPRWAKLLAVAVIPVLAGLPDLPLAVLRLPDPVVGVSTWRWRLMALAVGGLLGLGLAAQAYRYRRVSTPIQRQQTKWIIFSGGTVIFVLLVAIIIPSTVVSTTNSWFAWAMLATTPLFVLFPVAIANSVIRYRLYDIDRLINRTLVYGLLTAVLAAVYASVVLVLGQVFGGVGGEPPGWAIAGATLAVAALFQPARHRIQQAVDRRFNRRRYDAVQTIEAFSARLRAEIDLDTLSAELLAVVNQTMEPTKASLWLRPIGASHPSHRGL